MPGYSYIDPSTEKKHHVHKNILDLCIKNQPGLIKTSHSVGPPEILDHCAVLTEADINLHIDFQLLAHIKQEIRRQRASFSKDNPNNSVNENWLRLKARSRANGMFLFQLCYIFLSV